jgi:hypothetical protein
MKLALGGMMAPSLIVPTIFAHFEINFNLRLPQETSAERLLPFSHNNA